MRWLLFAFLLPFSTFASERFLVGHNLSPTPLTLPAGKWSIGNYALAYGLSDSFTVATSPQLAVNYNMPSIDLKKSFELQSAVFPRAALEAMYFKTFPYFWDMFEQESVFLRGVVTAKIGSLSLHAGAGLQYFFREDAPFSLRPYPWNGDRHTVSLSGLFEYPVAESWGVFVETGVLGMNYQIPFMHAGLSVHRHFDWGYVQIGASLSRRPKTDLGTAQPPNTGPYSAGAIWLSDRNEQDDLLNFRTSLWHSEVQVQFLL